MKETAINYKDQLYLLLSTHIIDPFSTMIFGTIHLKENKLESFEKSFNEFDSYEMYTRWHTIADILPDITDKELLNEYMFHLDDYCEEIELNLKTIKVKHNNPLFRELNVIYQEKHEISIYDKIECHYLKMLQLLHFVKKQVERHINKLNTGPASNITKVKYRASQTQVACYYLLGERLGIYYEPRREMVFTRLVSTAEFLINGEFKAPADINSILSRVRKGREKTNIKSLNSKTKKKIRLELQSMLHDLDDPNFNLFD